MFHLQYLCPSRMCYCVVTSTPNPVMSKSSSGLSMGLIPALLPPRKAAGKGLLCPHKDLGPHSGAHECWAQATEGGSCPTCGTFGTCGAMCVQGDE